MNLAMVAATENYFNFIRELRNNPITSKGFINSELISEDNHLKYMQEKSKFYRVCLLDGLPVGYIGVIDNDIRIAVHNDYTNTGIGTFMLNDILKYYPDSTAKIKVENLASIKLFEKLGFERKYYIYEKK
jgi:RimJ/RimL family protein N-acetyltransferase